MRRHIRQIREDIVARGVRGPELIRRIREHGNRGEVGYDETDFFFNVLLGGGAMPVPSVELEPEMVEYYKTPARVVIELAERIAFGPEDTFYDLGSGLGQVVLLTHLLTGIRALGVEIEPAYCAYARRSAESLGLTGLVSFSEEDVRNVDLSQGTVFFLFTPFMGDVFREVMDQLKAVAAGRQIRIISYGPCSAEIARLDWLKREGKQEVAEYELQFFTSC